MSIKVICCSGAICENTEYFENLEDQLEIATKALGKILECNSSEDYFIAKKALDEIKYMRETA